MLKQLTLKNFVLVESLDIAFNPGLTTITGESGAGKSILLNALSLLLGERAKTEVIRPGADKADVCAEFDLQYLPMLAEQLTEDELLIDGEPSCLVRRVVSSQGRSRAFVNGTPVTTAYLKQLGGQVVDIQGQNEHLRLADRPTQLEMLDDYAKTSEACAKTAQRFHAWQGKRSEIEILEAKQRKATDRQELLTYQLSELDELNLADDEVPSLEREHKRLANAQSTLDTLSSALDAIERLDELRAASATLHDLDDDHEQLITARDTLATAVGLVDDAARDLRHYRDQTTHDPQALADIDARLSAIQDLARKHRIAPEQLADYCQSLREELANFSEDSDVLEQLKQEVDDDYAAYREAAEKLSVKRRKAAPKFARQVAHYMNLLGIKEGDFDIAFDDVENDTGIDRVEFHVTTNPDFPSGPLNQITSGGEQTRIALSIQIIAAEHSNLPCLVLDEADVGVGGTTADTVGRILRDLGTHTQVICVTHAPQVAALGNNHLRVVKLGNNTDIHSLDTPKRIEELARMLAGADITKKTREYAESLLLAANE